MSLTMFAFFEIYKLHSILHYVENQNIPSKIRTASKVAGMLAFTKYNFIQIKVRNGCDAGIHIHMNQTFDLCQRQITILQGLLKRKP